MNKWILILVGCLLTTVWVTEVFPLDLWVQDWFYSHPQQSWIWSKQEPVARLLFYDGIKVLLILFALLLLTGMVFGRWLPRLAPYQTAMRVNFLALMIIPLLVGWLKATTNVACPVSLEPYGGDIPYIGVFEAYPEGKKPAELQRCFPAGHASGGFALLALFLFFKGARAQVTATAAVVTLGWVMGSYKMIIGDHFISHTLITMLIAALVVLGLILPWRTRLVAEGVLPHSWAGG